MLRNVIAPSRGILAALSFEIRRAVVRGFVKLRPAVPRRQLTPPDDPRERNADSGNNSADGDHAHPVTQAHDRSFQVVCASSGRTGFITLPRGLGSASEAHCPTRLDRARIFEPMTPGNCGSVKPPLTDLGTVRRTGRMAGIAHVVTVRAPR